EGVVEGGAVADVGLDLRQPRMVFDRRENVIAEVISIDNADGMAVGEELGDEHRTDVAGAAGDQDRVLLARAHLASLRQTGVRSRMGPMGPVGLIGPIRPYSCFSPPSCTSGAAPASPTCAPSSSIPRVGTAGFARSTAGCREW